MRAIQPPDQFFNGSIAPLASKKEIVDDSKGIKTAVVDHRELKNIEMILQKIRSHLFIQTSN